MGTEPAHRAWIIKIETSEVIDYSDKSEFMEICDKIESSESATRNMEMGVISMCEWCDYKETEWLLYQSLYWSVYLADRQDYIGRCILVLNRHCGSLSELDISEWTELKTMIDRLERLYKEVLGAELCNWSCLLNDFYKEAVPNPHLHIHVRPRYKNTVVINDHAYTDTEFAHHYALKKESVLLDDDRKILYALMKKHFVL